jgi:D-alanyl-D-alanine-carboxypeptidase/D-alanyl-D-alanine-endopeptidase
LSQLVFLLLLLCNALPAAAGIIPERVETALRDRIASGELSSAVVAMVSDGQTQIEGFGTLPGGKVPDGETLFEIGSLTKTFTATLLAEAVTRGEVTLDEPVQRLLPGFALPKRGDREITLLDIAEHRSGLPRIPGDLHAKDAANPYADFGPAQLKDFLAGYALPRDPGAHYEYSNLAVGMLGYALAESRHQSYGDLVSERILKPLGMTSTGIGLRSGLAPGFDAGGRPVSPWDFNVLTGASGLHSDAADLLRYVEAYMGHGAATDLAKTPRQAVTGDQRIGLIWMTLPLHDGRTLTWHNGITGGYASFAGFTSDGRQGLVILTNRARPIDDLGFAALDAAAPLAPARKEIALSDAQLKPFEGIYKVADKLFLSIALGKDQLIAHATGQPSFPLFSSGETEFFAKLGDISMSFAKDGSGLVLHQNGDHSAPRIADRDAAAQLGAVPVSAVIVATYAGRYELAPGQIFEFHAEGNQLSGQLSGQASYPLFARSQDRFFYLVVDAEITFQPDGLVLHQGGRDLPARKLQTR